MLKQATLILTTLMLTTQAASADWFVQPKIGFESRSYELNLGNGVDATADIPGIVFGVSFINASGWYIDLDLSGGGESEVSGFFPEDDFIESGSSTLSTGVSLGSGFTVFGGYTRSDTQMENHKQQTFAFQDFQFVTTGLFGGIAKSFTLAQDHSVTISGALGSMTGSYQAISSDESAPSNLQAEGEATGVSGSITYTYRPTSKTALTLGAKQQSYTYTNMTGVDFNGDYAEYVDAEESMSTIFAKASYTF